MLSEKYRGSALHFIRGLITGVWFMVLSLFRKYRNSSLVYVLKKKEN